MQLHNHLSGFLEVFKMHTRVNKSEKHKKKKRKKKEKEKKEKFSYQDSAMAKALD